MNTATTTDLEYRIITARSSDELGVLVNEAIRRGWKPLGGVAHELATLWQYEEWAQAMTREGGMSARPQS